MRVVIDTNTWISRLLLSDSVPARAVDRALQEAEVLVSEASIEELADVLSRDKWDRYLSIAERQEFLRGLYRVTTMIPVLSEVEDCRDPKDNKFLALAFDAQADYLVTGDRDLLVLNPWREIGIIKPADFLTL